MVWTHRVKAGTLVLSLGLIGAMGSPPPAAAQGVLWGGFVGSYQSGVNGVTAATFQRRDARIDFAWSGNFALTLTRFPQIGRLSPNIYFSHGCSGHGVTTTHLLGRLVGEAIAGAPERFDILAKLPYYPFPGGKTLRVPLTVLGSWYYRARDKIGI